MNIIITGASAGIGYSLAALYAQPSVNLGLIGRNPDKLATIAAVCRDQGAHVVAGAIDVSNTRDMKEWLLNFDGQFPVDLIIANAGVTSIMPCTGEGETWSAVSNVLNINIFGVFNTVHPLLDSMRERKQGQIAIVSSLAAFRGMPISPAYCASKAAVKSYGDALRGWLRHDGICVSVICPGFVKSELSDRFPEPKLFMMSADKAARLIRRGLSKNKGVISFPFSLAVGMQLLTLIPPFFSDRIMDALQYGGHSKQTHRKP